MNTQHTPGPWIVQTNDAGTRARITDSATEGVTIADIPLRFISDRTADIVPEGTRETNARLIAAAPETAAERDRLKESNAELLSVLEETEKWLHSGQTLPIAQPSGPILKTLRAAIAKAKGQQ